ILERSAQRGRERRRLARMGDYRRREKGGDDRRRARASTGITRSRVDAAVRRLAHGWRVERSVRFQILESHILRPQLVAFGVETRKGPAVDLDFAFSARTP